MGMMIAFVVGPTATLILIPSLHPPTIHPLLSSEVEYGITGGAREGHGRFVDAGVFPIGNRLNEAETRSGPVSEIMIYHCQWIYHLLARGCIRALGGDISLAASGYITSWHADVSCAWSPNNESSTMHNSFPPVVLLLPLQYAAHRTPAFIRVPPPLDSRFSCFLSLGSRDIYHRANVPWSASSGKEGLGEESGKEGSGEGSGPSGKEGSGEGSGLSGKESSGEASGMEGSGKGSSKEGLSEVSGKEGSGEASGKEGSGEASSKEGLGIASGKEGPGVRVVKKAQAKGAARKAGVKRVVERVVVKKLPGKAGEERVVVKKLLGRLVKMEWWSCTGK
ncbi:hypothetical protein DFH29DRAFT_876688 [Suillus ampliporus]|nr:hypothetical protein DFH29DRAFT_876688 [Suillus ampliporus]